ncbi:hypothetical protein E2C01_088430 [Portunus trituberculatus]|uniref:Uncharacterized protein n=1 Tax=Portunus trituberculatus TaxID=210409 RepID=A0A5B7JGK4_PORTR|nr:hypothetical protein [Portunus trituberculatus]
MPELLDPTVPPLAYCVGLATLSVSSIEAVEEHHTSKWRDSFGFWVAPFKHLLICVAKISVNCFDVTQLSCGRTRSLFLSVSALDCLKLNPSTMTTLLFSCLMASFFFL